MPIPITEHPRYGEEMAKYQAAKNAAAESGDQTQIAAADAAWQATVNRLQNEMYDRQQAEATRQAAVAQAKAIAPNIPDLVLSRIADPADIVATAEAWKSGQPETPAPAATPTPGQGQQPAAQSWGGSPPTGASQQPQNPDDPKLFHEKLAGLAEKVETNAGRDQRAVDEFGREYFGARILPGMVQPDKYKQMTGRDAVVERR